jgi:Histidine kinase
MKLPDKVQTAISVLTRYEIAEDTIAPLWYRQYLRYRPETPPPLFGADKIYWTWLTLAWGIVIGIVLILAASMLIYFSGNADYQHHHYLPFTPLAQLVIWSVAGFAGWLTVSAQRESVRRDRIAIGLSAWEIFDASWQPPLDLIRERATPARFWLWGLYGKVSVTYGEILGAGMFGLLAYFLPNKASSVGAAVAITYAVICIVALERSARGRLIAPNAFWWQFSNGFWMGFLGLAVTWTIIARSFGVTVDDTLFVYVLAVVLLHMMDAYSYFNQRNLAARIERAEQAKQLAEARLQTLKAQIEPHFIFNTIAHLKSMIATEPVLAERMADELSDFYRASLTALRNDWSTVKQEMELARAYLEIAKLRMGSRLSSTLHIGDNVAEVKIPPLLLQTLLENAIEHGVEPNTQPSTIHVSANRYMKDDNQPRLVLRVVDTGVGFRQIQGQGQTQSGGTGVGLANIRERLNSAYGGRATLTLNANTPSGVIAEIDVPEEE